MTTAIVGTKGQIVIQKELRLQLGVGPGWRAVQRVVDGHLEVVFLPPRHARSLAAALAPDIAARVAPEEWDASRESAWAKAFRASDATGD